MSKVIGQFIIFFEEFNWPSVRTPNPPTSCDRPMTIPLPVFAVNTFFERKYCFFLLLKRNFDRNLFPMKCCGFTSILEASLYRSPSTGRTFQKSLNSMCGTKKVLPERKI